MSSKLFFNKFVENLVEKAVGGYGKVNNSKSFLLFAPTYSISKSNLENRQFFPDSGWKHPAFGGSDSGKVPACQDVLRARDSGEG